MAMNNPAARLHNILSLCRQKELAGQPMLKAWGKVLGLPEDMEEILIVSKVGKVFTLPARITTEISRFDDLDQRLFLGWRQDLAKALKNVRFDAQFNHYTQHLSDTLLINIEFCSHELSKRQPEKMVEQDVLNELKEMACKLYDDVVAAKLDLQLSRYLLDHLYMVIEAIDDYLITGSGGLETSVDAVVGTFLTKRNLAAQAKESPFGKRFWETLGRIALALNLAKTALQLGEGIGNLIAEK